MGFGLEAYPLKMDKKPEISDLLGVFEAGPDVTPATVARRKKYFEECWDDLSCV